MGLGKTACPALGTALLAVLYRLLGCAAVLCWAGLCSAGLCYYAVLCGLLGWAARQQYHGAS